MPPRSCTHTANEEPEDGTLSLSVVARPQRKEQQAFRSKFGITNPELSPNFGFRFSKVLREVTGGRSQEWVDKKEIHLPSCFDWLLKDDKEVVAMLDYERQIIKHHKGKDPHVYPISLAHQAANQDPGLFLLAAACLKNPWVVAVPFKGEGSLVVEYDLDNPAVNMCVAVRHSAPTGSGRRLSIVWAGVSDDGSRIEDSAQSSWASYVLGHARSFPDSGEEPTASVPVRSASPLGSAMLCQLPWSTSPVRQNLATLAAGDRALARDFIGRTRGKILHQLKIAFRELVVAEQFEHQSNSHFATLGA